MDYKCYRSAELNQFYLNLSRNAAITNPLLGDCINFLSEGATSTDPSLQIRAALVNLALGSILDSMQKRNVDLERATQEIASVPATLSTITDAIQANQKLANLEPSIKKELINITSNHVSEWKDICEEAQELINGGSSYRMYTMGGSNTF